MPSPVHESIVTFIASRVDRTKGSLSAAIDKRIRLSTGAEPANSSSEYDGSQKRPDLYIGHFKTAKHFEQTCALEVGFAEKYEDLLEDMKYWMAQESVTTVLLVCINEEPEYRCPVKDIDIDAFPKLQDINGNMVSLEDPHEPFGPRTILGCTWVGHITAFLEVWQRNPVNKKPRLRGARMVSSVIPFGSSANVSCQNFIGGEGDPPALDLNLSDVIPIEPAHDRPLNLSWEGFREETQMSCDETAVWRCQKAINGERKRLQGGIDRTFDL